jgi:hypothetical protein
MAMYRRGGRMWGNDRQLSILEIVKSGTLSLRLASLLWVMMGSRPSVLVAAGPSFAGKTTTLNVLLDFLRPNVKVVRLNGYGEDFSFLKGSKPSETHIVAEEFSDYGDYIWGDTAIRAFGLIREGYALSGTIHATNPREIVYILHEYLGLPIETIAQIDAVVTLEAVRGAGPRDVIRIIDSVSVFVPVGEKTGIQTIASYELGGGTFAIADDKTLQKALSTKFALGTTDVAAAMREREFALGTMLDSGKVGRDDVRRGIVEFYKSHPV